MEREEETEKVNGWTNVPVRSPFPEPAEQDLPPPLAPVSAAKWVRFWAEGLIRAYYSEIKEEIYVMLRNLLFDSNDAFLHSMWFLRVHALQSKQGDAENRHCIVVVARRVAKLWRAEVNGCCTHRNAIILRIRR